MSFRPHYRRRRPPQQTKYQKAKTALSIALNQAVLVDGDLKKVQPPSRDFTDFDVLGVLRVFEVDHWPKGGSPVAMENFTRMVMAEFDRRWGVWEDGSGGVKACR